MILKIKQWCEGIIVAVIICIIIESLVPEGNNKKYIKVVVGIYIIYVTLIPIFNLLDYELNIEKIFSSFEYEEVSTDLGNDIKDVYVLGIEENIKDEVKQFGYEVEYVNVYVDSNYENIEKIELKLREKTENLLVKPIVIDSTQNNLKQENFSEIKAFISENYLVNKANVIFK